MRNDSLFPIFILAVLLGLVLLLPVIFENDNEEDIPKAPNDWFFQQRAFPYQEINYEARKLAWEQAQKFRPAVS